MKKLAFALSVVVLTGSVWAGQEGGDSGFPTVAAADAKVLEKLRQMGALAMPLAANTNVITVDFRAVADQTGDAQLAELKPVADQLVWLNLAATKVTDAGLAQLATLKNLQRLHLEKTGVTDAGLSNLKSLPELRYLNLYATKVTDAGLANLQGLKKLKSLFLWQTGVTEAGAEGLAKAVPGIMINRGWEAEKAKLPPPVEEKKPEPAAAAKKPINAKCPLSGKDVDPAATSLYKEQLIGFCCTNCKGKFDADPPKFIAKVTEFKDKPAPAPAAAAKKAINAKCPRNDMGIDANITLEHKGVLIAFCSDDCKTAFPTDPDKYINRYPHFKEAFEKAVKEAEKAKAAPAPAPAAPTAAKAVNVKCPVSGEPIDAKVTSTYKNQVVAFCCKDCKAKFDKEPDKFAEKIKPAEKKAEEKKAEEKKPAGKAINAKCPLSGKDINPEATFTYKNQVIAFCCNNCKGKFEKDPAKFIAKVTEFKDPDKK